MTVYERGIEVIVGVFLINDLDQVLLFRSPKWDNNWVISGGHVEPGETLAAATKRETKEEVGVDIEIIDTLNVREFFVHPPEFKRDAHFVSINSIAKITGCNIKLDGVELTESKWFDIDDALNLPDITPSVSDGLKQLKVWFKNKTTLWSSRTLPPPLF
jgi:nucleoside triphosphatase